MCNYARIRIFPLIQGKKILKMNLECILKTWNIRTYKQNMLCSIKYKQLIHVFSRASARSIFQVKPETIYIIRAFFLSRIAMSRWYNRAFVHLGITGQEGIHIILSYYRNHRYWNMIHATRIHDRTGSVWSVCTDLIMRGAAPISHRRVAIICRQTKRIRTGTRTMYE